MVARHSGCRGDGRRQYVVLSLGGGQGVMVGVLRNDGSVVGEEYRMTWNYRSEAARAIGGRRHIVSVLNGVG